MSSWSLQTVTPCTVNVALVLLWLEEFISISVVTLRDRNECMNIQGPTAVSYYLLV
jgi:hypothetical protein